MDLNFIITPLLLPFTFLVGRHGFPYKFARVNVLLANDCRRIDYMSLTSAVFCFGLPSSLLPF